MKKIRLLITFALCLTICAATVISASAKTVNSIDVTEEVGVITVSGTTESGMLACAVMVYDENGKELKTMETCQVNADSTFSVKLSNTFTEGKYLVKVADYNGGAYVTKVITVTGKSTENVKEKVADTGDYSNIAAISAMAVIGAFGTTILVKKSK